MHARHGHHRVRSPRTPKVGDGNGDSGRLLGRDRRGDDVCNSGGVTRDRCIREAAGKSSICLDVGDGGWGPRDCGIWKIACVRDVSLYVGESGWAGSDGSIAEGSICRRGRRNCDSDSHGSLNVRAHLWCLVRDGNESSLGGSPSGHWLLLRGADGVESAKGSLCTV